MAQESLAVDALMLGGIRTPTWDTARPAGVPLPLRWVLWGLRRASLASEERERPCSFAPNPAARIREERTHHGLICLLTQL